MALITIVGFPCSGKSSRAEELREFLSAKILAEDYAGPITNVQIISDHSVGISPGGYEDSASEKSTRGTIFTNLQRQLAVDRLLILDSLNYIKGFRYQIYCAAREMKLRTCTVHIVATPDLCRKWNAGKPAGQAYGESTLENLLMRFEEPSSMVRWDAPLFTILWTDEMIPGDQIWEAITKGKLKPPNSGTLSVSKAPSDALHVLEQTTSTLVSAIISACSCQPIMGSITVALSNSKLAVTLPPRIVTLSEMQRIKRQFVTFHRKAITLGTTERGAVDFDEDKVARKFAEFIAEHVR